MAAIGGADQGVAGPAEAGAHGRPSLIGALRRHLEAEQEQWFLWLAVLFGGGGGLYFMLPFEPWAVAAVLPAVAALALRGAGARAGLAGLASAALLAVALGVAVSKVRTEF